MSTKTAPRVRREYTITKFSMHPDGYLHCRITFEGKVYYVHERSGSWMVDTEHEGKKVVKEVLEPYKSELAQRARTFRAAIAKREKDKRVKAAEAEALLAINTGYKDKEVEEALMKRFELTKDEACGIMQQVKTRTEDNTDGKD